MESMKNVEKIINIKWDFDTDLLPKEAFVVYPDSMPAYKRLDYDITYYLNETYGHGRKVQSFDKSSGYAAMNILWDSDAELLDTLPHEVTIPKDVAFPYGVNRALDRYDIKEYLEHKYKEKVLDFSVESIRMNEKKQFFSDDMGRTKFSFFMSFDAVSCLLGNGVSIEDIKDDLENNMRCDNDNRIFKEIADNAVMDKTLSDALYKTDIKDLMKYISVDKEDIKYLPNNYSKWIGTKDITFDIGCKFDIKKWKEDHIKEHNNDIDQEETNDNDEYEVEQ